MPRIPMVATGVSTFMSPVFATFPAMKVNVPLAKLMNAELEVPFGSYTNSFSSMRALAERHQHEIDQWRVERLRQQWRVARPARAADVPAASDPAVGNNRLEYRLGRLGRHHPSAASGANHCADYCDHVRGGPHAERRRQHFEYHRGQ